MSMPVLRTRAALAFLVNDYASTPCSPDEPLLAEWPLTKAREWLRRSNALVAPIRTPDGLKAVRAIDLRRAVHLDLDRQVGDLVDEGLAFETEQDARSWLDADPGRHGALVRAADGTRVERAADPVRTAVVMAGGFGSRLRPTHR